MSDLPNAAPRLALIDWGTTSFRLWLMDAAGDVIVRTSGREGMTYAVRNGFENVLARHLAQAGAPPGLPVLICGMAGARQGWREAAYVGTPAPLADLAGRSVKVDSHLGDIRILPGISHGDPAMPSVMRGEETQLLGLGPARGNALVCMPGTHCKWVEIADGIVSRFSTFMTGELFDVLSTYSILQHALDKGDIAGKDAFRSAVPIASAAPELVWSRLFALRASQLLGQMERADGAAHLSGLLIGAEIGTARRLHGAGPRLTLVASGPLAALYRSALEDEGFDVHHMDADDAALSGLLLAARRIWPDRMAE